MSFSISGVGGASSPHLVSGASPYSTPTTKMTNLFQTIDSAGTGSISQLQFNNAFRSLNTPGRFQSFGASAIYNQLDPKGTGSVSKSDFVKGMTALISSFGKSENAISTASVGSSAGTNAPAQTLNQGLQSLELLGNQSSTNQAPGSVVNKLI